MKNTKMKDVEILSPDINRLDDEWVLQPKLFHTWARREAKAQEQLDTAKAVLKVVDAELDRDIRSNPKDYGIEDRVTEVVVANTILLRKKHQRAQATVIQAQLRVNLLSAMVKSLQQRRDSLEGLVFLWSRDYFSSPRADPTNYKRMEQKTKEHVRKMSQRK